MRRSEGVTALFGVAGLYLVFAWLDLRASIPGDVVIGSVVLAQTKNERSYAFFSVFIFIAASILFWRGGTRIE